MKKSNCLGILGLTLLLTIGAVTFLPAAQANERQLPSYPDWNLSQAGNQSLAEAFPPEIFPDFTNPDFKVYDDAVILIVRETDPVTLSNHLPPDLVPLTLPNGSAFVFLGFRLGARDEFAVEQGGINTFPGNTFGPTGVFLVITQVVNTASGEVELVFLSAQTPNQGFIDTAPPGIFLEKVDMAYEVETEFEEDQGKRHVTVKVSDGEGLIAGLKAHLPVPASFTRIIQAGGAKNRFLTPEGALSSLFDQVSQFDQTTVPDTNASVHLMLPTVGGIKNVLRLPTGQLPINPSPSVFPLFYREGAASALKEVP